MKATLLGCLLAAGLVSAASAQVTPIGPFTGDQSEGFAGLKNWSVCVFCSSIDGAFNGICTLASPDGSNSIHITGGWGFICSIGPHATPDITASTGGGGYDYNFQAGMEAGKFGGYFGTNSGVADGTVEFYDAGGALIGSAPITYPADCSWNWNGWEINPPAAKVRVIANGFGGAYCQMDDMEWAAGGGPPPCYPDCNGDSSLNLADFGCFQTKFALGDPYADCNGDQVLNLSDFGCFTTKFALGCP
jgi:hypothetical protein